MLPVTLVASAGLSLFGSQIVAGYPAGSGLHMGGRGAFFGHGPDRSDLVS